MAAHAIVATQEAEVTRTTSDNEFELSLDSMVRSHFKRQNGKVNTG